MIGLNRGLVSDPAAPLVELSSLAWGEKAVKREC